MNTTELLDREILIIGSPTKSGKTYPLDVCKQFVQLNKDWYGHLGRVSPTSLCDMGIDMEKVSHVVKNLRIVDNKVLGDVTILSTPMGQVLQAIDPSVYSFGIMGVCAVDSSNVVTRLALSSIDVVSP